MSCIIIWTHNLPTLSDWKKKILLELHHQPYFSGVTAFFTFSSALLTASLACNKSKNSIIILQIQRNLFKTLQIEGSRRITNNLKLWKKPTTMNEQYEAFLILLSILGHVLCNGYNCGNRFNNPQPFPLYNCHLQTADGELQLFDLYPQHWKQLLHPDFWWWET
jgi:hypothetical protein